jgi:hypothetical protein
LEERLAASRHEEEAAHLRGFILVEDHEWVVVAGIWQGASVALAAMQLWIRVNLRRVAPGFPEHVRPGQRAELVKDFATAADAIVAAVDVEEILHGGG